MQRQQVLSPHLLTLPDGSWWVFGSGGRWYRLHPADLRWHLCPPPAATMTRRSARPAPPGSPPPQIPPQVFPRGPDLAADREPPTAVVGRPVPGNILFQLRQILSQAGSAPAADYPLSWRFFASGTPSTVAVTWAAMLWCASVPVFDLEAPVLELWQPYLSGPLESHGRMRWLLPPSLGGICALPAERLRAGRPDAAGQLARFMVMTARALREDPRFRFRADALLAMVEPILSQPAIDREAVGYGDTAVEQRWMRRCPPPLSAALSWDTSPGECFRQAWYDLASALRPVCGDPDGPGFIEPRNAATAMLAADMASYRPDLAGKVGGWLDPEAGKLLGAILGDPGHPLRRLWPKGGRLPDGLAGAKGDAVTAVLGAAVMMDLSWCRLAGGIPIPPDGFTVPDACLAGLEQASGGDTPSRPGKAASAPAPAPAPAPPPTPQPAGYATPPPFPQPGATPPPFPPPGPSAPAAPAPPPPQGTPQPAAHWDAHGAAPAGGGPADGGPAKRAGAPDPLEDEGEGSWTRVWGGGSGD